MFNFGMPRLTRKAIAALVVVIGLTQDSSEKDSMNYEVDSDADFICRALAEATIVKQQRTRRSSVHEGRRVWSSVSTRSTTVGYWRSA
jgi:hypothetical protein